MQTVVAVVSASLSLLAGGRLAQGDWGEAPTSEPPGGLAWGRPGGMHDQSG